MSHPKRSRAFGCLMAVFIALLLLGIVLLILGLRTPPLASLLSFAA